MYTDPFAFMGDTRGPARAEESGGEPSAEPLHPRFVLCVDLSLSCVWCGLMQTLNLPPPDSLSDSDVPVIAAGLGLQCDGLQPGLWALRLDDESEEVAYLRRPTRGRHGKRARHYALFLPALRERAS